jgi:hypothetical protein
MNQDLEVALTMPLCSRRLARVMPPLLYFQLALATFLRPETVILHHSALLRALAGEWEAGMLIYHSYLADPRFSAEGCCLADCYSLVVAHYCS